MIPPTEATPIHTPAAPILVTGATGFIGSYVVRALLRIGMPVRALRRGSKTSFVLSREEHAQVEWIEGDLLDIVSLQDALEGCAAVVHAAAVVSFRRSQRKAMYETNVEGTRNLVNMTIECSVPRLVHLSSVAALGRTRNGETVDENKKWNPQDPHTHYAITKHAAELEVWRGFAEGLTGLILNPSTVLGFGNWHHSSPALFRNAWTEAPWYTRGVNGFVGVEDLARAASLAVGSSLTEQRFLVSAENISFEVLFQHIAKAFGKRAPHRLATPFLGEVAWRLEWLKGLLTRKDSLLTRETARIAQSETYFDNSAFLEAFPGFVFEPLADVIARTAPLYSAAVQNGRLAP